MFQFINSVLVTQMVTHSKCHESHLICCLFQGYGWHQKEGETYFVPYPFIKQDKAGKTLNMIPLLYGIGLVRHQA